MRQDAPRNPVQRYQDGLESVSGPSQSSKIHNSDLAYLGGPTEDGAALVHAEFGVTEADCPICAEEPHHAAARTRPPDERAALVGLPLGSFHVGRTWSGHPIEDECPCAKAVCGLVETRSPDCGQHTFTKTMRQGHPAADCPGGAL